MQDFFELHHCLKAALGEDMAAEEDVKVLMASASVDTNEDGLLDEAELVRLAREMEAGQEEEARRRWLWEAFRRMQGRFF
jgi:hypothetical protein